MFTAKKLVIYLSRDRLKVGWVILGREPKLAGVKEYPWKEKKLAEALAIVKTDFKYEKVWVVLSDTLSYTLRFEVPETEKDVREYVAGKVAEGIPEILENDYWDYKVTEKSKKGKKVEVFAPVKDLLVQLSRAAKKVGLEVEVIEPASLSATRHQEPMIGVAMKKDIQGKDEEVLNVEPPKVVVVEEEAWSKEEEKEEEKKEEDSGEVVETIPVFSESKKKLPVFLIILILTAGTIGVFLLSRVITKKQSQIEPVAIPTLAEEPTSTPEPELSREDLIIQVQNGTGEPGAAGEGQDLLEGLGYREVETGNAPSYSYKESEISLKEEKAAYFDLLFADLGVEYLVSSESSVLDEDSDYDAVIILGERAEEEEVAE